MIEFRDVSFTYGTDIGQNGIYDINLTVKRGEFLVITGGSGCGKTTITRLINGLIPNYYEGILTGGVIVGGSEVSKAPIFDIAKYVGSVFQNPRSQFFNVDTTSELAFASENQGVAVEEIRMRIEKTVEKFNIHSLMNRSIFKLSGGEKQKIACASVSVAGTDIIVLDEPSSNLDFAAIEELQSVLELWKQQGKTVIIAEHGLYFLRELADRMLVMENGRIVEEINSYKLKNMTLSETKEKGLRPLSIESLEYNDPNYIFKGSKMTVSKLEFTYRDGMRGIAVDDLNISEKAIVAIVGSNGAGKSTFARCLCGLEKSCKGNLNINTSKLGNKERLKNCYMVMQDVNHQLFTESVLDEVILSMKNKGKKSEEQKLTLATEILSSLDLEEYAEIHPMALSGGQKQRVAIASAIASDRKIVLFDEPTSGLDYVHMNQVAENIKALSKLNKTVFVITHDLELILNCSTDILRLENGRVEEMYELNHETVGRLKELFTHNINKKVLTA